ncbi:molecular chaperone [Acinetobacter sp. ACNIH2]|uniref:fimbrial biogenesis chaperone n=1 Tax=Acinetobacter sp. ACNIH2 TaxID=1758189 RepID=UPI00148B2D78|nr:fimbria/pilus periplasmic chaperone [Acinetobacter sp. ACNIH2]
MRKIILFLILSSLSNILFAGIKFTPVQLYLGDKHKQQRSTTVIVESSDFDRSKIFELSAVKWSQNEKGEDVLEEEKNILFNPKIFELKPESKQIVRVGFSQPFTANELDREKTWRVIFNEVTPVADDEAINFQFNFSLPLFVGKQDKTNLDVKLKTINNNMMVDIQNIAKSHVQITDIRLVDSQNKELLQKSFNRYLLVGQKYTFDLGELSKKPNDKIKVKIKTDKDGDLLEY